jgi:hypothetical protein
MKRAHGSMPRRFLLTKRRIRPLLWEKCFWLAFMRKAAPFIRVEVPTLRSSYLQLLKQPNVSPELKKVITNDLNVLVYQNKDPEVTVPGTYGQSDAGSGNAVSSLVMLVTVVLVAATVVGPGDRSKSSGDHVWEHHEPPDPNKLANGLSWQCHMETTMVYDQPRAGIAGSWREQRGEKCGWGL